MARERIPRETLRDELRRFLVAFPDRVWEVSEDAGGNLMHYFLEELGPRHRQPGWQSRIDATFLTNDERRDIYEFLWSYVVAGILQPLTGGIHDQSRKAWGQVYLTPFGREVLEGGTPIPEDIEGYLTWLTKNAPRLDQTARFYVDQALRAFKVKLFPASAVMLGCAAEHVMDELASGLLPKLLPGSRGKLAKAVAKGPLAELWRVFRDHFDQHRAAIFTPLGLAGSAEIGLDGLFLVVKQARDDAGHPKEVRLDETDARALLQAFLEYARYASHALAGVAALPNI